MKNMEFNHPQFTLQNVLSVLEIPISTFQHWNQAGYLGFVEREPRKHILYSPNHIAKIVAFRGLAFFMKAEMAANVISHIGRNQRQSDYWERAVQNYPEKILIFVTRRSYEDLDLSGVQVYAGDSAQTVFDIAKLSAKETRGGWAGQPDSADAAGYTAMFVVGPAIASALAALPKNP